MCITLSHLISQSLSQAFIPWSTNWLKDGARHCIGSSKLYRDIGPILTDSKLERDMLRLDLHSLLPAGGLAIGGLVLPRRAGRPPLELPVLQDHLDIVRVHDELRRTFDPGRVGEMRFLVASWQWWTVKARVFLEKFRRFWLQEISSIDANFSAMEICISYEGGT